MAAHTDKEHFYKVDENTYPSVTAKLACLKDPSLTNFKMNEALRYVFAHFGEFTAENIMHHLAEAEKMPSDIFEDAGDIGTEIHNIRETYFSNWIKLGRTPTVKAVSSIPLDTGIQDTRIVSAMRALDKFIDDYRYEPVATELKLYSHKLKIGGTLDDIGWMHLPVRPGSADCVHDFIGNGCAKCDYKVKRVLALVDLKSSNQTKFYFAYQVAMYYAMWKELTGIKLDKFYILRVSKTDGTYALQEIYRMPRIVKYAKHVLRVDEGNEIIKESFKKPTFKI